MSFRLYNGKAWFDTIGVFSANVPSFEPPGSITASVSAEYLDRPIVPNATSPARRYSLYSPELQLLAETDLTMATPPPIAYEYVWFNGEPVAQIESATGTIHYYFNDHLGTPVLTTNSTAAVDWRVEREPYGTSIAVRVGLDRYQPLGFPGQEEFIGTDRGYHVARWLRTSWGRFTQADPIGLAGSINLYAYAADNSSRFTDPTGLTVELCCRPVQKAQILFHCFVRTNGPGPASYSLFPDSYQNLWTGLGAYGIPTRNHPDDLNAVTPHCRSTPDSGCIRQCIENLFNQYPKGAYKLKGPNSNTFAGTMARVCGLNSPAVANDNDAPGWSSKPPQPF